MTSEVERFWDAQAPSFDDEPDHGCVRRGQGAVALGVAARSRADSGSGMWHGKCHGPAVPGLKAVTGRWTRLLRPDGRLVLVRGRWLWGGPITGERYLLVGGMPR